MRCRNCYREVPDSARACIHCEAPIGPKMTGEELEAARKVFDQMPPDVQAEMVQLALQAHTNEEFVNAIMTGNCPNCDSEKTSDCECDPEIECNLVGRCYDCGQMWCTECGKLIEKGITYCECWDEEDSDLDDDEDS